MLFVIKLRDPKAEDPATPVGYTLASPLTVSSPCEIVEAEPETPTKAAPFATTVPIAPVPATPVSSTDKGVLQAPDPQAPLPHPLTLAIG